MGRQSYFRLPICSALLVAGLAGFAAPPASAACPPNENCEHEGRGQPAPQQRPQAQQPQFRPQPQAQVPQPQYRQDPHPMGRPPEGRPEPYRAGTEGRPEPYRGGPEGRPAGEWDHRGEPRRVTEAPPYSYHGRSFAPIAVGRCRAPAGYRYERFAIGYRVPLAFIIGTYVIADWAAYDLAPPPYGLEWIRVGPDMLLVDPATGQVVDAVYGAYVEYDGY